jgi:membrane protease YdiL (CAAX protease family)
MTQNKLPVSRIAFAFTLVLFLVQFGSVGIAMILSRVAPFLWDYPWLNWVLSYVPLYCIYFPIFYLLLCRLPNTENSIHRPQPRRISIPHFIVIILFGLGISTGLNVLTTLISVFMNLLLGVGVSNPMAQAMGFSDLVTNVIMVAGVAPLMEELIFRKFLYQKLIGYGPNLYILVSSLFFMCFHTNLYQMGYAFVLGLILSSIYAYTGKFRYNWGFHFILNSSTAVVLIISTLIEPKAPVIANVYGVLLILAEVVGVVIGICLIAIHHKKFHFGYGTPLPIKSAAAPLINPGMITLYVLFFFSVIFTQLSGLGIFNWLLA